MINWKVRIKNKTFWLALIPALLILAQAVAALFGYTLELSELQGKIIAIIDSTFGLLAILGIVVDPTTKGIQDSERALSYDKPN